MTQLMGQEFTEHRVLSEEELFARFHGSHVIGKHLLVLYSLAIGLNAKVIAELGLGHSTGALRAAAQQTGGTVYSCDIDRQRFAALLAEQDQHWRLFLEPSQDYLSRLPEPVDFAFHDAAHDYSTVKRDLRLLIPKMRQFGVICVHDTQQTDLIREMLPAVRDAVGGFSVSLTNLPYSAGLCILRVESSTQPPISPVTNQLNDGRPETTPAPFPTLAQSEIQAPDGLRLAWRKIRAMLSK